MGLCRYNQVELRIEVGPKFNMADVLARREKFGYTGHVKVKLRKEAETGVMHLKAKECPGLPVITRS